MKIAILGYGKMGKTIERIALERGHTVVLKINIDNTQDLTEDNLRQADVAIEFSGPEAAFDNILFCLRLGVPVVSGSTGWLQKLPEVHLQLDQHPCGFLYASNFSLGVNLFFVLNETLARLMAPYPAYTASLTEVHHTAKQDAPSGTAITLANQILAHLPRLTQWTNTPPTQPDQLYIESKRIDPAPGTHIIRYQSAIDTITIEHEAHTRDGFALGAVVAAEFLQGKVGVYSMREVLGL
jgi:4-hydroxy-tetrahydrodipicolinate reductase